MKLNTIKPADGAKHAKRRVIEFLGNGDVIRADKDMREHFHPIMLNARQRALAHLPIPGADCKSRLTLFRLQPDRAHHRAPFRHIGLHRGAHAGGVLVPHLCPLAANTLGHLGFGNDAANAG